MIGFRTDSKNKLSLRTRFHCTVEGYGVPWKDCRGDLTYAMARSEMVGKTFCI